VVKVTGGSNRRVPVAALLAVRPGQRPRLVCRTQPGLRRKDGRKGFTETDYARLLDAAHQQLAGPLVVVWDNLNAHVSAAMAGGGGQEGARVSTGQQAQEHRRPQLRQRPGHPSRRQLAGCGIDPLISGHPTRSSALRSARGERSRLR
jgi:hypothetical protein